MPLIELIEFVQVSVTYDLYIYIYIGFFLVIINLYFRWDQYIYTVVLKNLLSYYFIDWGSNLYWSQIETGQIINFIEVINLSSINLYRFYYIYYEWPPNFQSVTRGWVHDINEWITSHEIHITIMSFFFFFFLQSVTRSCYSHTERLI